MQFSTNGPDIPEVLLQAHEEGRVVFFCGAGISYPADLPGFKGLVENIYKGLGTGRTLIEDKAFALEHFDATLDLLERRIAGQRIAVRKELAKSLQPKLRRKGATDTHAALLQLARSREGGLRLVTTNFDRVFEHVAKRDRLSCSAYAAPMLPIPKNSRWDGVVYLHGLLPAKPDDSALHRLVLTSGDFGLAYLTERWAARFVTELFRNYMVCFVGYSINDPVLRYMMDALAADRMLGEVTPQAYALGDFAFGEEHDKTIEWGAKGVTPILYEVPAGSHDHSALHQTLKAWAETYRDGVLGKESIVVKYALARPSVSTQQDEFVGRMLWALSHQSGLPAKRFADHNPAPPLEWLEAFTEDRYRNHDLSRFGVPPHAAGDRDLQFSLIRRPAPYERSPWMTLVSGGTSSSQWDDVMHHIARWLVRYLNDPALILWLVQRGSHLHDRFLWLVEDRLNEYARLEKEDNVSELNEVRKHAPQSIPGPLMQTLWRLLLTNRVKSPWRDVDLYRWKDRLKRDGLTTTLRLELREVLAPKVALKKPFHWDSDEESIDKPTRVKQLVDWELVLSADHVHSTLRDLVDTRWKESLPILLDDFQQLLRDALDLLRELGETDDRSDRSNWDLPSISPHWQNRGFRDWVALIELLRDAWLAVRNSDPLRATQIASGWFQTPYPTFKRLALFAASQDSVIAPGQWVDWLLADGAWWLWSSDTQREVMRLLVLQGRSLTLEVQRQLEAAILTGPPREMYKDDLAPERWQNLLEHSVWLLLSKLSVSGLNLGEAARIRLAEFSVAYPQLQIAANERDEFSHWMSGTGDPDYEESRDIDLAPRKRQELVQWLKQPPTERRPFYEDTWRINCKKHFLNCLFALCDLTQEGIWPAGRWREALQAWSEDGQVRRSWRYASSLVQTMPDDVLQEVAHGVTWWLEAVSKSIDRDEAILLSLCRRVLDQPLESGSGITRNGEPIQQPVTEAINHPIGHVTQVLLNVWLKASPNDGDRLPADIEPLFTQVCDTTIDRFRHGRVLLASRLIAFFRVDRPWTERYLLPLFDWKVNPVEARSAWEGFLWSPRLYRPLMIAFKPQFLETARHYSDLGEHGRQFASLLTYAAQEPLEGYTFEDFRSAVEVLPPEGLQESAQALSQALEGAGDQREDYWKNRVQPFWQNIWPKSGDRATDSIAESLARLCIAAGAEFPSALTAVLDWLYPIEHPHYVVHRLYESGLIEKFPADSLRLLNAILKNQQWAPRELGQGLDLIVKVDPSLAQDARHLRLREYSRRHGV